MIKVNVTPYIYIAFFSIIVTLFDLQKRNRQVQVLFLVMAERKKLAPFERPNASIFTTWWDILITSGAIKVTMENYIDITFSTIFTVTKIT